MSTDEVTLLVVDDSAVDRLLARRLLETGGGWRVVQAADGVEAMVALTQFTPAAVLTDMQMPRMDGLALVGHIRREHPRVPVVLMTGSGSEEIALAALQLGAASYVPKRNIPLDLVTVIGQVLTASQLDDGRVGALRALRERVSRYVLDNDPALIPPLVQVLREELVAFELCDATGATRVGTALKEALLNAVYHGNLEVGSVSAAASDGSFERLVAERRDQSPYRDRQVALTATLNPTSASYVITDQGLGFDVSSLPAPTDTSYLGRATGRGVLFMRTFADEVMYNSVGNQVMLVKRREQPA
ncbi:response regulator [Gemmata sp. JC717]|uniref:response regulator n=1 Tax=Gemmata algarum TaxID=2975278 RepID=UPI0021BB691C|nr:response regulator [Gemmata algarum]MDY3555647.1 response regulator [Gemmata algarum]